MLPVMIYLAALIMDGGMLMGRRRQTQAVADASMHAAACLLAKYYLVDTGLDPLGKAKAAALAIAKDNGYANDASGGSPAGDSTSLTINIPPTSGVFANKAGNAEVIVTYNQPRYFSSAFLSTAVIPVTARAVGRVVTNAPASIILTDPSAAGALTLTGTAKLTTSGVIQVNSNSMMDATHPNDGAVNASNGAYATDSGGLSVVGNVNIPNWATNSTFFSVDPKIKQSSVSDPYAPLAPPSAAGLSAQTGPTGQSGSVTMNPGVYSIDPNLGHGLNITMNPGIYYRKAGFTVANNVNLNGSGVMIYMDSGGGSLNFQGGCTITLSPPTSGTYSGIVYYQDRANSSKLNNIANGSMVNMGGTVYAPSSAMTIAGGASGATYGSQYIVKSLNLSNGVNININTPKTVGGTAAPFLAE